jgi:hypothetical protein
MGLPGFVGKVLALFSPTSDLMRSTATGGLKLAEAHWTSLFFMHVYALLPSELYPSPQFGPSRCTLDSCRFLEEFVSSRFHSCPHFRKVDLYINSALRWAVEFLRDGPARGPRAVAIEHIERGLDEPLEDEWVCPESAGSYKFLFEPNPVPLVRDHFYLHFVVPGSRFRPPRYPQCYQALVSPRSIELKRPFTGASTTIPLRPRQFSTYRAPGVQRRVARTVCSWFVPALRR